MERSTNVDSSTTWRPRDYPLSPETLADMFSIWSAAMRRFVADSPAIMSFSRRIQVHKTHNYPIPIWARPSAEILPGPQGGSHTIWTWASLTPGSVKSFASASRLIELPMPQP